jgi:hypothetical protein
MKYYKELSRTNERGWVSTTYLFLGARSKACHLLLDENSLLFEVTILA